jgi:hypothetical protein
MIKTIDTLVPDLYEVVRGQGGWYSSVTKFFSEGLAQLAEDRFSKPQEPRDYIGLSQVGNPCKRELWYVQNDPAGNRDLSAQTLGNFFYGDMIELFVISLVIASGHRVDGLQQKLEVFGIPGTGDCIIDGMVVDIKSASEWNFPKFRNHKLKEEDPYGYISQLSSYLYGYKDDPRVTTKDKAAFLAINKNKFEIVLDVYDLKEELAGKQQEIESLQAILKAPHPPERLPDVPEGKSGNRALSDKCGWCSRRGKCWPDAKAYQYSNKVKWLTKVVREPKVDRA